MSPDQEPTPAADRPEQPGGTERPLRAHARRNRENLVAAARAAFAAADDTVPLEGIARRAGVGIGTLYRHFPTREALVEAVYAAELDAVTDSAAALVEELPPEQALRAWMERYADGRAPSTLLRRPSTHATIAPRMPTPSSAASTMMMIMYSFALSSHDLASSELDPLVASSAARLPAMMLGVLDASEAYAP